MVVDPQGRRPAPAAPQRISPRANTPTGLSPLGVARARARSTRPATWSVRPGYTRPVEDRVDPGHLGLLSG